MTLAPGAQLGSYEIVEAIGAGGMGEVFRARDPRLGREIAIKVLSQAHSKDPEALARFTREAKAVAALNHPHIVTIFSTEEADGVRFMTMELISGQPLNRMIPAGGFALPQFFDIAIPLTEALRAAHRKNITHRDLKPANIMVSDDGLVKVLDFGLARPGAAGPRGPGRVHDTVEQITRAGVILGTVPYMSPEQLENRVLDHRTDLFSLGVLLYEMSTGIRPFQGSGGVALMASIVRDRPRAAQDVRPELPTDLSKIIARCLEKKLNDRIQTADEVLVELNALRRAYESPPSPSRPASTPSAEPSLSQASDLRIAVLPFVCRTAGSDADGLAEGLTQDIIAGFAQFPYLRVVSRPDAMKLKGQTPDPAAASLVLGARYLVEGHVRTAGSSVRIGVHLLDSETGAHLWAETYDREFPGADVFALQDDIKRRVVATVGDQSGVLARSMGLTLKDLPCEELCVAELVLRFFAHQAHNREDEHALLRTGFERALAREPREANGWASLADLYHQEYSVGFNPLKDITLRHGRAAERSVEIDPACQNGWKEMAAHHYFFERDLSGLRLAAERVVSLNPLNTSPVALVGSLLASAGDWERGTQIVREAMEPNPHHPGWYHFPVSNYHYVRGEYDKSLLAAKRINMPGFAPSFLQIAMAAGQLGLRDDATAAFQSLERVGPEFLIPDRARDYISRWAWDPAAVDHFFDGFVKAQVLVGRKTSP
ncbi:MAG: protein kinase [Vicinamibacteria bacterium]|nr:protein kinase [Vicinamibacteria bacterium]